MINDFTFPGPPYSTRPPEGYRTVEQYFDATLQRMFKNSIDSSDYIFFDSRRQTVMIELISYGISKGWLSGFLNKIETQYARYEARLTEEGRRFLIIEAK